MRVPVPFLSAIPVDGHKRDAVLDQPAREQRALTELGLAIALADRLGLRLEVEGVAEFRRGDQAESFLVLRADAGKMRGIDVPADLFQQTAAFAETVEGDIGGWADGLHVEVGPAGVLQHPE